ncbi:hypothetical protein IWQ60_012334 [Tieghemiomyces parasiticus]|uniref:Uncharacterized protein n=1 Tax=Tieghemiomyces parasiticus TaxID=78921 RepID=A0A9W7ZLK8_9FUNG|nr:hypothetical protein IWQ60_012334 [Tieghemiomyces parasiticus]
MATLTRTLALVIAVLLTGPSLYPSSVVHANTEKRIFSVDDERGPTRVSSVTATSTRETVRRWTHHLATELSWRVLQPKHSSYSNQRIFPFPPSRRQLTYFNPLVAHRQTHTAPFPATDGEPAAASDTRLAANLPSHVNLTSPFALEHWYILAHLSKAHSYEARVSYPASSPADFQLDIFTLADVVEALNSTVPPPAPNTAPVHLTSPVPHHHHDDDPNALAPSAAGPQALDHGSTRFLRVRAFYAGFSHLPNREKQPVHFNIVLEQLYLYIPYQAYKLAVAIALAVLLAILVLNPLFTAVILDIRDHRATNDKEKDE